MRKLIVSALALMAAHALVSCKKKDAPPAAPPVAATGATGPVAPTGGGAAPVAMVPLASPAVAGDVLGSGAIGSIDELVTAIEPYLAAMGSSKLGGAAITAQIGKWIGLETWEGIDGAKPMRVWLVNPKKFKPPFVVALPLVAGKKAAVKGWAMEEIAGHAVLARGSQRSDFAQTSEKYPEREDGQPVLNSIQWMSLSLGNRSNINTQTSGRQF